MIDINKYDLIGNLTGIKNYIYPKFYVFIVTNEDYKNKFVYRYFVQKINNNFVVEVSEKNYNNISKNLFNKLFIKWYLIGPKRNVYVDGKLYEQGVYEKNLNEVNLAAQNMPSIKNFITDYTQYNKV